MSKTAEKKEAPRKPTLAESTDAAMRACEEALDANSEEHGAIAVRTEQDFFDAHRYLGTHSGALGWLLGVAYLAGVERGRG